MIIYIKVKPGARIEGVWEAQGRVMNTERDFYVVAVKSKPEKGKANERVCELLAKHFNINKSQVFIKSGKTSREKIVEILV